MNTNVNFKEEKKYISKEERLAIVKVIDEELGSKVHMVRYLAGRIKFRELMTVECTEPPWKLCANNKLIQP